MLDAGMVAVLAPFLMVVGIVWVKSQAQLEEKRIAARMRDKGPDSERRDERIEELEERVRILERIVTDGGYDLAHRIEALRDERPVGRGLEASHAEEKQA